MAKLITILTCIIISSVTCSAATDTDGMVLSEFVFEKASFPQCHASTIISTDDGILCAWFGGTHERHDDVGIWVSHRSNDKWSDPVEVANGVQSSTKRYPCWNPVLFQPAGKELILFYKVGPSPSTWWGMEMRSTDSGKTWTKPRRLPKEILGPIKNKPIQLSDGTILSGSSTEHDGWRVQFERSQDNAKTWQRILPEDEGKRFGVIQPTLLSYPNNTIQALCRSRMGKIVETISADGGKTWSKMSPTALPNPNAGFDGVTLKDGRQLLVYNHTVRKGPSPRHREMINVAISEGGKDWKAALVLENEKGAEFSYPAVIQSPDGLVHISYTWKRRRIKHADIDVSKLKFKDIENSHWPF